MIWLIEKVWQLSIGLALVLVFLFVSALVTETPEVLKFVAGIGVVCFALTLLGSGLLRLQGGS